MAGQNYTWQISTPNLNTGVGVISSAYNVDNKSPFTTITGTNTSGYVKVFPDSTSTDLNIKNLEYAIQTDGKITYRVQDGTQNPRQYNSLQELADGRGNWTGATTKQVQSQIKSQLETFVSEYNTANPTTPIGPPAAPAPDTPLDFGDINVEEIQSSIEDVEDGPSKTRRKEYGFYTYPINMDSNQDRILFTMKTIKGSNISASFKNNPIRRTYKEEITGSVTLPIQPSITDSNTVDWSGLQLNALDSFVASASFNLMNTGGPEQFFSTGSNILQEAMKQLSSANGSQATKLFLAQEAAGVQGLLSRATGAIINPNLELLFNGPQLRSFSFTFRMSPRSEKEAIVVKNIIRFFKQGMSVKTTKDNVFLKSPNVFDIKYKTGDAYHPSINRIKTCALLGCDIDYTPDGTYMTSNDGPKTMTSYGMTLRFSELDPIYDRDYNEFSKDEIGF